MQESFANMRFGARPSDPEGEERLRRLPPSYGRAVPDDVDIATFLADARTAVASTYLAAEITRGIALLESADEAQRDALVALEKARLRLQPANREAAARHAPILAMVVHATRTYDEKMLYEANRWLAHLPVTEALLVSRVVRKENDFALAEDLRCRAFHSLRLLVRRAGRRSS